jgi:hypothetical protein
MVDRHAACVSLYLALAAKSRQRADHAERALDFDLADSHTRLACGYAALAYAEHAPGASLVSLATPNGQAIAISSVC